MSLSQSFLTPELGGGTWVDIKVHHVFPYAQLCIESHCGIVTVIRLHVDHVSTKRVGLMLEEIDERGGNALPPVLAGDCEIIDIDLTTRLLKLGQNVSRESANNRFLLEGSKRDECPTTEQVPEVIGVRLMLGVGGYVSELTTEKIKSSPHAAMGPVERFVRRHCRLPVPCRSYKLVEGFAPYNYGRILCWIDACRNRYNEVIERLYIPHSDHCRL